MAVDIGTRLAIHELRKAERPEASDPNAVPNRSRVTPIRARRSKLGQVSKEEKTLLRSMALTVEDNPWQRVLFNNKFNSLAPTYDPTALAVLSYQNNTLRQCIAAMVSNIDGTGFEIKRKDGGKIAKVVSPESPPPPPTPEPEAPPMQAALDPKTGMTVQKPLPPPPPPPEKWEVGEPFPAAEAQQPIMVDPPDVAKLKAFWEEPYPGISFVTMRKQMRSDLETTGNAYLEIIRDLSGKIAMLNVMDSKLTRLIRHDDKPVAVTTTINRTGVPGDDQTITMLVHERRFCQIIGLNARFFKVYGSERKLNAQSGSWEADTNQPIEPVNVATEVLHFTADKDVLTPYGIPRWINQLPSVLGSRKAEELNLEFFDSGGVPPLMVLIQGGTLSNTARRDLTEYLAGKAKFKQRGVVVEVAPSGGDLNSAAQVKTTVEKLGDAVGSDSKFEEYDAKCTQRVRSSFRLPAVLIGLEESYNYATVQTAVMMAEEQVFHPERMLFDEMINSTLMKELDESGIYKYESKKMSVKFLDEQIKAFMIAKGMVEGKSLIDAMNESLGFELKFDQKAADMATQTAQAGLANAQAGLSPTSSESGSMAGTGAGSAEASTGAGSGGSMPNSGFGAGNQRPAQFSKSSTSLGESSTAINKHDAANPEMPRQMVVKVTQTGKIRKLDHMMLTNLAADWAGLLTGERHFEGRHVAAMHQLIKTMTPALRNLFAENVAQRVVGATNDPNGVKDLVSCASDVLARLAKDAGGEPTANPKERTLYVNRAVKNAGEIIAWAKNQGFETCLPPESMHVTVCYSKEPFDTSKVKPDTNAVNCTGGKRSLDEFGPEKDTVVLKFNSPDLTQDWQMYRDAGASWSYPNYQPHISLTMKKPKNLNVKQIIPYDGIISLGPELWSTPKSGSNSAEVEKTEA